MKEFKLLQKVKEEPSKNEKMRLLKEGETENLKKFLNYSMDRFKTYRVSAIEYPDSYNTIQPNCWPDFFQLLDKLASHTWGTKEAKAAIKKFLSVNTEENAEWFVKCIKRDLTIGIDEKSINKVWSDLIPTFDVMLAFPITEYWDSIKYPLMIDSKKDGLFTAVVYDGETVGFFSREGNDFPNLQAFSQQIKELAAGQPKVFIGEFDTVSLYAQCKSAVKAHKAGKNWKFQQSISMAKTSDVPEELIKVHQKLVLWDCVDYEYFKSKGKIGKKEQAQDRRLELFALFNRNVNGFKNLEYLKCYEANNKQEVVAFRDKFILDGDEGCMGKDPEGYYEFKRSKNVLKCKQFFAADLRIIDAIEGEGKFKGTLGALVMQGSLDNVTITCKVGSGYTDNERDELWHEFLMGRLVGQIGEVLYQEITTDNSLRFPSWLRLRADKTTTSFN